MTMVVGVMTLLVAVLIAVALRRLISPPDVNCEPTWLAEFSTSKYLPMLRLLSDEDYTFLALQSGFRPEIGKRLRSERVKIFRTYLRILRKDYARLHTLARATASHAVRDRSEVASHLIESQLKLSVRLARTHLDLQLYTLGIGTVNVQKLIGALDVYRMQVLQVHSVGQLAA